MPVAPFRPYRRALFLLRRDRLAGSRTVAKSPREMRVVAKAAGVRDFAERLACLQRRAAMQKARSVIFAAGRATRREQLLPVRSHIATSSDILPS